MSHGIGRVNTIRRGWHRTKKKCEKCQREIASNNYLKHVKKCVERATAARDSITFVIVDDKCQCPFCLKLFVRKGIFPHMWRVHTKEGQSFKVRNTGWLKGLTAKTDSRVAKIGQSFSRNVALGKIIPWNRGKKMSDSFCAIIKKAMKKAVDEGRQKTLKPGGITRCFDHVSWEQKAFVLQGPYEKTFAEFLDSKKIVWEKNQKLFPYAYKGETKKYKPDFYLKDYDVYVETKGYETDKDHAKWRDFTQKLFVVRLAELKDLESWFKKFLEPEAKM
jgi:hypothetical protein